MGEGLRRMGEELQGMGEGPRPMGEGLRCMGEGPWPMGEGLQGMGEGPRCMGEALQGMGEELRRMGEGLRLMGEGLRGMGEGLRLMGEEPRRMGEGPRRMVRALGLIGPPARLLRTGTRRTASPPRDNGAKLWDTRDERASVTAPPRHHDAAMNDTTHKPGMALADEPLVPLELTVNGDRVVVATRPSRTLLELLRYDLDLVGTKQGCDKGDCGACTVLIDGVAQLSCLTLALHAEGRAVTTVESLPGMPNLDPLLDAFDRCGAGQCGFCTPGMLMSATALLDAEPRPTRAAIQEAISGNLCRCTGYGAIVRAIEMAASIRAGTEPSCAGLTGPGELPPPLPVPKEKQR